MKRRLKNRFWLLSVTFFKIIAGGILVFVGFIFSIAFLKELSSFKIGIQESFFLLGITTYALFHFLFKKPIYLYIFGHELTHAISVFLCKGKVKSFHISRRGGRVGSTKSNFFIYLSPYLFPIYVILTTVIYFFIRLFFHTEGYLNLFLFFIGFTWAFHIFLTFYFLGKGQMDIMHSGRIFSLPLIYVVNLFTLIIILSCLSKQIVLKNFLEKAVQLVRYVFQFTFKSNFC